MKILNDKLWKLKDELKDVSKNVLKEMLKLNGQDSSGGKDKRVSRCAGNKTENNHFRLKSSKDFTVILRTKLQ